MKPGTDFEVPPGVGVPFFVVVAYRSVADTGASVSTTTKFSSPYVGKSGAVFVTPAVPLDTLGVGWVGTVELYRRECLLGLRQ